MQRSLLNKVCFLSFGVVLPKWVQEQWDMLEKIENPYAIFAFFSCFLNVFFCLFLPRLHVMSVLKYTIAV